MISLSFCDKTCYFRHGLGFLMMNFLVIVLRSSFSFLEYKYKSIWNENKQCLYWEMINDFSEKVNKRNWKFKNTHLKNRPSKAIKNFFCLKQFLCSKTMNQKLLIRTFSQSLILLMKIPKALYNYDPLVRTHS